MSRLESWQRYRKASPCPICAGYGAYKPENRCKGFLTADGEGAFCSQVADGRSPVWFESLGLDLYYHPLSDVDEWDTFPKVKPKSRERGSRIIRMRERGRERAQSRTRNQRAERPPHPKEFG